MLDRPDQEAHVSDDVPPFGRIGERIWKIAEKSGWHRDSDSIHTYLSALASEVGEVHNEHRDHGFKRAVISNVIGYDHVTGEPIIETPGKPSGVGPELADVIIRTLHLAYHFGIDIDYEVQEKLNYIDMREQRRKVFDN